jgi:hypothetical protein
MLKPQEIIDLYLPKLRHRLIEIAEVLDAYDEAVALAGDEPCSDDELRKFRTAVRWLAEAPPASQRRDALLDYWNGLGRLSQEGVMKGRSGGGESVVVRHRMRGRARVAAKEARRRGFFKTVEVRSQPVATLGK